MDGREVIVPNGSFMTESVVNLTRFPTRRAAAWLVVPAEVSLSVDDVRGALARAEGGSKEPPPTVGLRGGGRTKGRPPPPFLASARAPALPPAPPALRARFPQE